MDVESELRSIQREYAEYFSLCTFVSTFTNNAYYPLQSTPSHLHVITRDIYDIRVTVCVAGWYVIEEETYFPTFEALMNHKSPAFQKSFADTLFLKLQALE